MIAGALSALVCCADYWLLRQKIARTDDLIAAKKPDYDNHAAVIREVRQYQSMKTRLQERLDTLDNLSKRRKPTYETMVAIAPPATLLVTALAADGELFHVIGSSRSRAAVDAYAARLAARKKLTITGRTDSGAEFAVHGRIQ
jgi:Tfp pilus assembly protein PilN